MGFDRRLIWCDVGNTRMHFLDHDRVIHMTHQEGLARYAKSDVVYISVNQTATEQIKRQAPTWRPIKGGCLQSAYQGLGIDREAAILGLEGDGVVIDAGSAVTVDIIFGGLHQGGWIWPGLAIYRKMLQALTPALDRPWPKRVVADRLPLETGEALLFGYYGAIRATIERFAPDVPIVLCGGDAQALLPHFPEARIDEQLVFRGMKKMLKEWLC